MSNSVAEFLSKKGVKKFKNGIKANPGRAIMAAAVLATAFTVSSQQKPVETQMDMLRPQTTYAITEKGDTLCAYQAVPVNGAAYARLQKLVNNATKSDAGREILKAISEQGTVLRVDVAGKNTVGYFSPADNSICLNKAFRNADLQSCLVHEGKHSIQNTRLSANSTAYTFGSNIMTSRVMEADAVATQTKFAFEMAEQGDFSALKALKNSHGNVVSAYAKAGMKYGTDSNQTMKEAMLAWYGDKNYVGLYDASYVRFHAETVQQLPARELKNCFSKTQDADKVLTAVCCWKGQNYAGTDGRILQTPQTAYLDVKFYKQINSVNSVLGMKTAYARSDTSADRFYVMKDGRIADQTYGQMLKNNKSVKTAGLVNYQRAQQR